jgi:cytosine/adenosine deaminase-related metal-dependent hydrolase
MQIHAASWLYPVASPPIAGGAIAVDDDGRIVAAGPLADVRQAVTAPVHDYPGCAILPGLVNAHSHLELTHFPSWKIRKDIDYSPRTYVDWVIQVIKLKRSLTLVEAELSLREGLRISLEAGTTMVGDILSDRRLLPLYATTPLRGRLFFELLGQDPVQYEPVLAQALEDLATIPSGFAAGLSPHAPHTVAPSLCAALREQAAVAGLPLMVHAAESREEALFMHDSSGTIAELLYPYVHWEAYLPPPRRTTSIAWLAGQGLLTAATLAVHCVQVTIDDVATLKSHGTAVVLCPRSNERLAVGTAPIPLFRRAGVPLALGTDSLASNDSLSLWDELRFLLEQHPETFTPDEALELATSCGASALGLAGEAGTLAVGKRADFQVVELPGVMAADSLGAALIHNGRLRAVYCGGDVASGGG